MPNLILPREDLELVFHYANVRVAYLDQLSAKINNNNWFTIIKLENQFNILLFIFLTNAGYHGYPLHFAQTNCNWANSSFFSLFFRSISDSESDELPDELLPSEDDPLPLLLLKLEFDSESK